MDVPVCSSVHLPLGIWAVSDGFRKDLCFKASPLAALRRVKCAREREERVS